MPPLPILLPVLGGLLLLAGLGALVVARLWLLDPPPASAPATAAVLPPKPTFPPIPPRWYRLGYEEIRRALAERRTVIAGHWALGLIEDSTLSFGPTHPYTLWVWELLGSITTTAASTRGDRVSTWSYSDPRDVFLFPDGSRTAPAHLPATDRTGR